MNTDTIPYLTPAQIENFWKGVDKTPGQGRDGNCWKWQHGCLPAGYGKVGIRLSKDEQRTLLAHRIAYKLSYGKDPGELCVLHKCDFPPCCNAAHFFLGTRADNALDRAAKNRTSRGDAHWMHQNPDKVQKGVNKVNAKLTDDQVRNSRERYERKELSSYAIARELGMGQGSCWRMLTRKSWKHIE